MVEYSDPSPDTPPNVCTDAELESNRLYAVLSYRGDLAAWNWAFYVPNSSVSPIGSSGTLFHVINSADSSAEWAFEAETKDIVSSPLLVAIVRLGDVGFLGTYEDIVGQDSLLPMFRTVAIPAIGSTIHPAEFSSRTWFLDAICVLHDCGVVTCDDVWLLEREIRRFAFTAMDKYLQNKVMRQEVSESLFNWLNSRWRSADLVGHVLGDIVSIPLAARITLSLLRCGVLTVNLNGEILNRDQWPRACNHAASCASLASKTDSTPQSTDYVWTWAEELGTGKGCHAENFVNIVGMAAYLAAGMTDQAQLSKRTPTLRFTRLSRRRRLPLPLHPPGGQGFPPDFVALPSSAFVSDRDQTRLNEYQERPSALGLIEAYFPSLFEPYSRLLSAAVVTLTDSDHSGSDAAQSLSTKPNDAEYDPQLLSNLEELSTQLEMNQLPIPPLWVTSAVKKHRESRFLDMSRVCYPNVLVPGEGKQTDMGAALIWCARHMDQQRCVQPWLRFCLGLMATKDELGLLRADATGIEECVFRKDTGRGVIEAIRLSLGIMLATDQELGHHPAFSLRDTEALPVPELDATTSKKRPAPSSLTPPPAKYRFKEVNFVTLENSKRHLPESSVTSENHTRYYTKYLLEDQSSLVGRCTRIWCAYREVSGCERESLANVHKIDSHMPIFIGPYALKFYCADIQSEAYGKDILKVAQKAQDEGIIKHVLLPTDVWYLGKNSDVVRNLVVATKPENSGFDIVDREEIVKISAFKRTLAQFETGCEFYGAIIGVLKAIGELQDAGIMHRDVSFGNIVLSDEKYANSDKECEGVNIDSGDGKAVRAALVRRQSILMPSSGGLHDLDSAASIPKSVPKLERPVLWTSKGVKTISKAPSNKRITGPDFRTGTTPFMSIPLLSGEQNSVYDDLQSTFFVLYLSMLTFDTPAPNCYPEAPRTTLPHWPTEVQRWADDSVSMEDLGTRKQKFFQSQAAWLVCLIDNGLKFWLVDPVDRTLDECHGAALLEFHQAIWTKVEESTGRMVLFKKLGVKPREVAAALEKVVEIYKDRGLS
ncbi:hypothetical protein D9615_010449 [Tricholomella constricta]|uniref:Fungal-type protein kinase domain-containing protein n=1 Tax=Tricholomella constricta TaxID=117010 RepID=A0A8H5GLQ0_9AGAR|nr:hypothetical protein D9615_010449 [Tricholomella constricta]